MKDKLLYNDSGPSDVMKNQGAFSLRVQVFAQSMNFPASLLLELPLELKFFLNGIKSQTEHLRLMPSQLEKVEFYILKEYLRYCVIKLVLT